MTKKQIEKQLEAIKQADALTNDAYEKRIAFLKNPFVETERTKKDGTTYTTNPQKAMNAKEHFNESNYDFKCYDLETKEFSEITLELEKASYLNTQDNNEKILTLRRKALEKLQSIYNRVMGEGYKTVQKLDLKYLMRNIFRTEKDEDGKGRVAKQVGNITIRKMIELAMYYRINNIKFPTPKRSDASIKQIENTRAAIAALEAKNAAKVTTHKEVVNSLPEKGEPSVKAKTEAA